MEGKRISLWEQVLVALLISLLRVFRVFSDYVAYPAFAAVRNGHSKTIPRVDDQILLMSATDLADMIRSGELSSQRVVLAFITRLKEIDPILNIVTDERYKAAVDEAREVDAMLERCRADAMAMNEIRCSKPFLGVPITTKNSFGVEGLGNDVGLHIRKGYKASEDSGPTATMRASGAIPLAVTNIPEMTIWVECNNPLYGRTLNPYNTNRTCGGSSGGEGASLASCGSPFGIGGDFAGSIRIPAMYNGIFGLKPTRELTDVTGNFPMPKDILLPLGTSGPMCKYAKDLRPFLKVLVGPSNSLKMGLDSTPNLGKLKVHYLEDFNSPLITPVQKPIRESIKSAAFHLASLGESPAELAMLPKFAHVYEMQISFMAKAESPSLAEECTMMEGRMSTKAELWKFLVGRSQHTFPFLFVVSLEQLLKKTQMSATVDKFFKMSSALETDLEHLLGDDGVLVCPTLPDVAPFHELSLLRTTIIAYTGIWNILGFPAVSVPMGLSEDGMPIGLTVVAGKLQDNLCCEVAMELEKKFGGWVPPFETAVDVAAARDGKTLRKSGICPS